MNQVPLNDLSRIDDNFRSSVMDDVESIVRSGTFFKGRFTTEFEGALSSRFGDRWAACVGNGTDALYLALAALTIGSGDRVATVANAGGYSTNAILRCGARPAFVDVDPTTAQMSPEALIEVLQNDPTIRAVIVTHLYGLVGEVSAIRDACDRAGTWLIEDCAQSFGAMSGSAPAGTFGDLATFSFYPTKNLGAYGDAGAVVSSTAELDQRVRSLAQYGWSARYEITLPGGVNSRIDEMQAAILLRGLDVVDEQNRRRRSIALRYRDALSDARRLISADDDTFIAHLAVMVTSTRADDVAALHGAGVSTGVHYPVADHEQVAWRDICDHPMLPITDRLQQEILTLPCFPSMTDLEVEQVASALAALPARSGHDSSSSTSSM